MTARYMSKDLVLAVKNWRSNPTDAAASKMVEIAEALDNQDKQLSRMLAQQEEF